MKYDPAVLEGASKRLRHDMWQTVASDAIDECGIEERCFGPVQATAFETMPEFPSLNQVLGAAEPGAVSGGHLAAAIEWVDSLGVDYRVSVARRRPGTEAAERWLDRHGFEQGRGSVKYVRDGSLPDLPPTPPEMTVWEIGEREADGETLVECAAPLLGLPWPASSLLFGLPSQEKWRTYTVELGGEIVSFGSMLIHDSVALLGFDATNPEVRGRGCNQALLRQRLLAAFDAGCETVAMELRESDEEGVQAAARNLYRAGFVPAYRSMNWQRPRTTWVPLNCGYPDDA
jgi:GNAT superfamily N-acetyltransferase